MTNRACPVCHNNPTNADRYVCPQCTTRLRATLTDLNDRIDALHAAIGNQLQFGPQYREGGTNAETPLPYNQQASATAQTAKHTILTWTHHTAQARNEPTPTTWTEIGHYLDVRAHWIATQKAGPNAYTELLDALRNINRTIDRPRYRRIPLHVPCTGHDEDQPCPGSYHAILDSDNGGWSTIPDLTCDHNPDHIVTPAGFRTLRRAIDPASLDALLSR